MASNSLTSFEILAGAATAIRSLASSTGVGALATSAFMIGEAAGEKLYDFFSKKKETEEKKPYHSNYGSSSFSLAPKPPNDDERNKIVEREIKRIGKRKNFNTKKEAYEEAKRASGGKEPKGPEKHNDGHLPHYHSIDKQGNVTHDHFKFPKRFFRAPPKPPLKK